MDTVTRVLEQLACDTIGDGQKPNWYLVTVRGKPVMLTTDGPSAYRHWYQIAHGARRIECALEDRLIGTIADVSPESDDDPRLEIHDDSFMDRTLRL